MISARMLNKTCTITAPEVEKSTSGAIGWGGSGTTLSGIPCALQVRSSSNPVQYGQERQAKSATLYVRPTTPGGTAIAVDVHNSVTVDGVVWAVAGPSRDASGGRGVLLSVPLEAPQ